MDISDLFIPIRNGDLETVKKILAARPEWLDGPAPKKMRDIRYMSPLQAALCTGWHREIAWYLLHQGADVNYRGDLEICRDSYPVLFDGVCTAIWNARRLEWDGKPGEVHLVWKHTVEEADEAFRFLQSMIERGADVNRTDGYGRNSLMEAVAEANKLCPVLNWETGKYYPGRRMTKEMRDDFRRIFVLLIEAGADRENRSLYSGKTIREHHENESVWQICGDLF